MSTNIIPISQQIEELLQFVYLMPVAVIELGPSGDVRMLNPMAVQLLTNLDIDPNALSGSELLNALAPGLAGIWAGSCEKIGLVCAPLRSNFNIDTADPVHLVIRVVRPDKRCTMVSIEDVTTTVQQERELYRNRQQLGLVLEGIDGYSVIMLDAEGNVAELNPSMPRMFGSSVAKRVGTPLREFLYVPNQVDTFPLFSDIEETVQHEGVFRHETQLHHETGRALWGELVVSPTVTADGTANGYVVVIRDISEQHREQRRLFDAAMTDPLTSLLNRRGLEDSLDTVPHSASTTHSLASWIMLDIDHFKRVNDTYGHEAGDMVLKHVAGVVKASAREADIVARLGGEEFLLVLPGLSMVSALATAERIRERIEHSEISIGTQTLKVTASFGVGTQRHEATVAEAMRVADEALYRAKSAGRNCVIAASQACIKERTYSQMHVG